MSYTTVYYFGDSLSDGGGIFELTSAAGGFLGLDPSVFPPTPLTPPYAGVFSNGPVYSQIAPELLGWDAEYYALGGAQALGEQFLGDNLNAGLAGLGIPPVPWPDAINVDVNLGGQVARFLDDTQGTVPDGAAASVLIGLNDLNAVASSGASPEEAFQAVGAVIEATLGAATALAEGGVETIILNTLPDGTFFPAIGLAPPELLAIADLATDAINLGLKLGAASIPAEVVIVDLNALTDEITADPNAFGLQIVEQPVFLGFGSSIDFNPALNPLSTDVTGELLFDPDFDPSTPPIGLDQITMIDFVHPTAATHGIWGAFTAETLASNTLIRNDFGNLIFGGRSDDLVLAKGGDDLVATGRGQDVALGGLGDDVMWLGSGSDLGSGGAGDDFVHGKRGSDAVFGASGDDAVWGGGASDVVAGGLGSDDVSGGNGDDLLIYVQEALLGGPGGSTDHYNGGRGVDHLMIAVTSEDFAAVETELAAFQAGEALSVASLGLSFDKIESVTLVEGRDLGFAEATAADLGVSNQAFARLQEADLWGFV
ncbi:MAG: SGNH/GDSL hydrolase family protein [Pseudomonadota bacterium]